jgi:tetratricopeptide (TPR) repeat protein
MTEEKDQSETIPNGFITPDGEFLTDDQMEERMKTNVAACQNTEEREDAKRKLIGFYFSVAKPLRAFPMLEEIQASTKDPENKRYAMSLIELLKGDRETPPSEQENEEYAALLIRLVKVFGRSVEIAGHYFKNAAAIANSPATKAECYLGLGRLCEQMNRYEDTVQYYSHALELLQETSETWYFLNNNLGYSLIQLGRNEEAELYCHRAIAIDPSRYNAYKNIGLSLCAQGNYRAAAKNFIRAVEINPADERAMNHLEDLLEGRPELYKELFGTRKDGLEALRRLVFTSN